ncbi:MAG TPA: TIGR00730 family Rossman fold protein [Candidatus Saccharimonadales bacterium]|nr:TIGR00730 family Rossman fold protein [Candidatus Saccharimonadales bacterium]
MTLTKTKIKNEQGKPAKTVHKIITQAIQKETADRLSRIEREFSDAFKIINTQSSTITVFGSARFKEGNPYYEQARTLTGKLSERGFTIVTGGGGGIMEAGNRGAFEAGGASVGLNIKLPHEQILNDYTTESMPFYYFFTRKVMLAYDASAFVFLPGGFGTMDELFEILTLIQTGKIAPVPVILIGKEFWQGLDGFIKKHMADDLQTIDQDDRSLYVITDDLDEAVDVIGPIKVPAAL